MFSNVWYQCCCLRADTAPGALFLAGLPRARSARGTEPHTHRFWSTSFRLVVTWLTERTYVSTDCTGGLGETIKRKGGVSQARLSSPHLLHWTITIRSIDSCQNSTATEQYPMTISRAHVSTHWGDVIYLEAVRWPVSYFLASLGSEHRKTDTHIGHQCCDQLTAVKTRYPLTSITWLYRGLRCRPIEVKYFFEVIRWQGTGFQMIAGSSLFFF